ncbi:unnamed protein product [Plutella xylostella]|uniref:(diamondback moth) hypothetical protein n=1 Tax=Plutella xylostella TaxID=51655 RepID=A0A8S4DAL6_PLUXY|nr:unnamed protein product [Plutella xylostella]
MALRGRRNWLFMKQMTSPFPPQVGFPNLGILRHATRPHNIELGPTCLNKSRRAPHSYPCLDPPGRRRAGRAAALPAPHIQADMNFSSFPGQAAAPQHFTAKFGYEAAGTVLQETRYQQGASGVQFVPSSGDLQSVKFRQGESVVVVSSATQGPVTLAQIPIQTVNTGVKYHTITSTGQISNIAYGQFEPTQLKIEQRIDKREYREEIPQELMATHHQEILRRKWSWIGHCLRRPEGNIAKMALDWNPPQGIRRKGRPAITWRRSILSDLNAVGISWDEAKERAQDRNVWRRTVEALCSSWS